MHPKVSILIPCYNAEQWIAQAIESALDQTYANKEVIVVDDGSTDRSLPIIQRFDQYIHWETQPNQGGNITRNRLLELSTGEWLQYLDADDYLLPEKVQKQVNFLSLFPDSDVIWSPGLVEYQEENSSYIQPGPIHKETDLWVLLARWFLPQTGRVIWRKKALIDVGNWKVDQPCCQEHELYLRLLIAGKKFRYLCESDSVYRLWKKETVSRKEPQKTLQNRLQIEDRIEEYLKAHKQLNRARSDAINQARFECARLLWNYDRDAAIKVISKIKLSSPRFKPSPKMVPTTYIFLYKILGFPLSERIAQSKRSLLKSITQVSVEIKKHPIFNKI
jgi:glycosyltransferase involved in cell wall biosynthesis